MSLGSGLAQFIIAGLWYTTIITVLSFLLGSALGVPLVLMKTSRSRILRGVAMSYIEVFRGIPSLVWLMLLYFGLATLVKLDSITAAVVGLGLVAGAYMAENYRAALRSIPRGQFEAAEALGLSGRPRFVRVVAPQALTAVIPTGAVYAISLLKESAVASLIGVHEVMFRATTSVTKGAPPMVAFGIAGTIYILAGLPVAALARAADRRIRLRMARA